MARSHSIETAGGLAGFLNDRYAHAGNNLTPYATFLQMLALSIQLGAFYLPWVCYSGSAGGI